MLRNCSTCKRNGVISHDHIASNKKKCPYNSNNNDNNNNDNNNNNNNNVIDKENNNISSSSLQEDSSRPPWSSVSFACGGWLQLYMFGVARSLQARGMDCPNDVQYLGCSAGGLTAAGICFNGDFDAAVKYCKDDCIPAAYRNRFGLFQLTKYMSYSIDNFINPGFKIIKDGYLQLATTRLPYFTKERMTMFNSKQDLKLALLSSAAAFPFADLIYHNGYWKIDGGLTDFQPIIDKSTVTVSPFYFMNSDIKPSRYVPFWWGLFPPNNSDTIDWLYNLGFADGNSYLDKNGIKFSENAKIHLQEFNRRKHPYDKQKEVSFHRFFGYNLSNIFDKSIVYFFDMVFLFLFIFLWKPLTLLLIYTEVILCMIYNIIKTIIYEFNETLPLALVLQILVIIPHMISYGYNGDYHLTVSGIVLGFSNIWKLLRRGGSAQTEICLHSILECLVVIGSLSLLQRFWSLKPSKEELRKHDRLFKISLLYRVFRHII